MKQAIRICGHSRRRQRDQRTDRGRLAFEGNLVEQSPIHVGMTDRIVLHQIRPSLDRHGVGTSSHRQIDFHIHAQSRPDLHILRGLGEPRGRHRHVIRVKRYVRKTEIPLTVSSSRPVKAADRVVNLHRRIRHHRTRRVEDGPANPRRSSARLRARSPNTQHHSNGHNSRGQPALTK